MARRKTTEDMCEAYLAALNSKDLNRLDAILSEGFVSHLRVGEVRGRERFKALMGSVFEAFPDLCYVIDEAMYEPDRFVVRYHFDAVQRAPFLGVPASHKMVRAEGIELVHCKGGRVVEIWNYADVMGLAAQLGSPSPLTVTM